MNTCTQCGTPTMSSVKMLQNQDGWLSFWHHLQSLLTQEQCHEDATHIRVDPYFGLVCT